MVRPRANPSFCEIRRFLRVGFEVKTVMPASQVGQHTLTFGSHKVTLYKRGDTQDSSWFFRIHLKDEDRFYRKSLDTKDKDVAAKRAHDELIALLSRLQSGQRILALSLTDLVRRFSLHCEELVRQDQLSAKTWINHRYRIGSGVEFLKTVYPEEVKLSSIDGEVFRDYLAWRTKKNADKGKTIRRDVVRDELLIIRKMFNWALKERLCPASAVPNWDFHVEKEGPKRQRITQAHFKDFMNVAFSWSREAETPKDAYQRRMVLYVCVVVAMSGLRSGEIFGLKRADIQKQGTDVLVKVRPETSKIRRGREIVVPDTLAKWLGFTRAKEPRDFVFCGYDDPTTDARDIFYHLYGSLRARLKEIDLDWFDLYHCRHWYITNQLLAEQPIHLVAQAAGTSVKEIESTYSHVLTELTTRMFNKKKVVWKPDGSYAIIKRLKTSKS
jgi:integrase